MNFEIMQYQGVKQYFVNSFNVEKGVYDLLNNCNLDKEKIRQLESENKRLREQCDELDKENQELQDQYRWRDVNEELPKNNQVVLVRFYSGSIYPMIYKKSESIHYFEDDIDLCRYEVSDLTHWQPMPEFK